MSAVALHLASLAGVLLVGAGAIAVIASTWHANADRILAALTMQPIRKVQL